MAYITPKHPHNEEGMLICLECGELHRSLSGHIRKHGLVVWEYLVKYNLSGHTELTSISTSNKITKASKKNRSLLNNLT